MSHSENDIRCSKCKHPLKHAHFYQGLAYGVVCVKRVAEKKNGSQKLFGEAITGYDIREGDAVYMGNDGTVFKTQPTNEEREMVIDEKAVQRWEDYKAKYGLVEIKEN